jgi:hypothetical protein
MESHSSASKPFWTVSPPEQRPGRRWVHTSAVSSARLRSPQPFGTGCRAHSPTSRSPSPTLILSPRPRILGDSARWVQRFANAPLQDGLSGFVSSLLSIPVLCPAPLIAAIVVGGRRSPAFGGEHDRRSRSALVRSGQSCLFDRCYRRVPGAGPHPPVDQD